MTCDDHRSPAPAIVAVLLAWACVGSAWWAFAVPGINLGHAALILSAALFLRMARHLPRSEDQS